MRTALNFAARTLPELTVVTTATACVSAPMRGGMSLGAGVLAASLLRAHRAWGT